MGKIRSRMLGSEEIEKEQKEEQKKRAEEKKMKKTQKKVEEKEEVKEPTEEKAPEKKVKPKKEVVEKVVKAKVVGKRFGMNKKMVESGKLYTIEAAVALLKKMKLAAFVESVEFHANVESTGLKGEVELPHTTGKSVRVVIVDDALLEQLAKGIINFDVLITHPSYMPKLARYAKVLGPKGLMPNPKAGTISPKPEEVAKKFSKGLLRWKTEPKFPIIHQMVGKISHTDSDLVENIQALIKSIGKSNMFSAYIKTTMSPSVKLDIVHL